MFDPGCLHPAPCHVVPRAPPNTTPAMHHRCGSMDLAGLGVLETLAGGWACGWGEPATPLWEWGLWEVGKLLHTAGEGTPSSRGAGGTRSWCGAAARNGLKWSKVLGYQVSGWHRADPDSPSHPTRELQMSGAAVPSLPHTVTSLACQGCLPTASVRLAKC